MLEKTTESTVLVDNGIRDDCVFIAGRARRSNAEGRDLEGKGVAFIAAHLGGLASCSRSVAVAALRRPHRQLPCGEIFLSVCRMLGLVLNRRRTTQLGFASCCGVGFRVEVGGGRFVEAERHRVWFSLWLRLWRGQLWMSISRFGFGEFWWKFVSW